MNDRPLSSQIGGATLASNLNPEENPMRYTAALLAALALACGGSDNPDPACEPIACGDSCGSVPDGCGGTLECGGCGDGYACTANACVYQPPIVDPTRLGVACPAPEVMIRTTGWGEEKPAGELKVGDQIYAPASTGGGPREWTVTGAERLTGQQRLRLVLTDGREIIFTPDHALFVSEWCSVSDPLPPRGWIELRHLRPGWCVDGPNSGIVERVENAPDGDVIRLSIGDEWEGQAYWAEGLWSLAHNSGTTPQEP